MGYLFDDLPDRPPIQRLWQGFVAKAPLDFADRISVVVSALDSNTRFENCRWQSRNSIDLPARGDDCLVVIDNNNEVWVVAWWPFQ